VTCVVGDLRELSRLVFDSYDVIICMGDTLTQLGSEHDVERLLGEACANLALGGTLLLTFRDYAALMSADWARAQIESHGVTVTRADASHGGIATVARRLG
jgi:hypothetical protein